MSALHFNIERCRMKTLASNNSQSLPQMLRTRDAARLLNLSPSSLEKMRVKGGGPIYIKSGPRVVVYHPDDLAAWLDSRRRQSTSAGA
jgi:hypothetical protein